MEAPRGHGWGCWGDSPPPQLLGNAGATSRSQAGLKSVRWGASLWPRVRQSLSGWDRDVPRPPPTRERGGGQICEAASGTWGLRGAAFVTTRDFSDSYPLLLDASTQKKSPSVQVPAFCIHRPVPWAAVVQLREHQDPRPRGPLRGVSSSRSGVGPKHVLASQKVSRWH